VSNSKTIQYRVHLSMMWMRAHTFWFHTLSSLLYETFISLQPIFLISFLFFFLCSVWATYKNRTYLKRKKCAINKMILVFGVFVIWRMQWKCFLVEISWNHSKSANYLRYSLLYSLKSECEIVIIINKIKQKYS
jgi:accessory gene regulator protein AgrB